MQAPAAAASHINQTAQVHVAAVIGDEPPTVWRYVVDATVGSTTFAELATLVECRIQLTWRDSRDIAPWVVGFFPESDADNGCADRAAMAAQMKTAYVRPFHATVGPEDTNLRARVVLTWRGHPQFSGCTPLHASLPTTAELLDTFMRAAVNDARTLPPPPKPIRPPKIVVREAYAQLVDGVRAEKNHVVITGAPGVGKTTFLWYVFRLLRRKGKVVIFDCDGFFLLAQADGSILEGKRDDTVFRGFLNNCAAFYLCDATPECRLLDGSYVLAKTIVTVSPDPSIIHRLVEEAMPTMLTIPPWSLEELDECLEKCDAV